MNIQTNDIYQLGDHFLACGDSSNSELLNRLIGNKTVSAIITDPPYGVDVVASKASFTQQLSCQIEIANDHEQSEAEYIEFSRKWLSVIKPYLAPKNSIYIFNSDKMIFALRQAMLLEKYKFTQLLIWIKSQAVIGRLDYLPQHELIAYGWYKRHDFKRSKSKSILFYPKPAKSKLHATMKPVGLMRELIFNSTAIGDYIFEPFGGSGSTIIGCEHTKRRCLAIEINHEHCATIIKRFEKLTGMTAKLYEPGQRDNKN